MKAKHFCCFLGILLLAVFLTGCNIVSYYQQDPFYRDGSEFDHVRFPLIKPYYAMSLTHGEPEWVIPLENELPLSKVPFLLEIVDVRKIAVAGNVIMVYTPDNTQYGYTKQDEKTLHWFILIPDKHLEMGFETEADFLAYIQKLKIQEPSWRTPLSILQEYDQTWCLDWIPACQ